jgi:hypothetical protein
MLIDMTYFKMTWPSKFQYLELKIYKISYLKFPNASDDIFLRVRRTGALLVYVVRIVVLRWRVMRLHIIVFMWEVEFSIIRGGNGCRTARRTVYELIPGLKQRGRMFEIVWSGVAVLNHQSSVHSLALRHQRQRKKCFSVVFAQATQPRKKRVSVGYCNVNLYIRMLKLA